MDPTKAHEKEVAYHKWLVAHGYSGTTIRNYMVYYRKLIKWEPLDERNVQAYITQNNHSMGRAGLKMYLVYTRRYEGPNKILIPQMRGRKKRPVPKVLRRDEIVSCFDYAKRVLKDDELHVMLRLMYECGLRRAPVLSAKVKNVDMADRSITVFSKGKKESKKYFSGATLQALQWLIAPLAREDPIFPSYNPGRLSRRVMLVGDRALKKRLTPHMFRHSIATHLREDGHDLKVIAAFLDHESIATTQVYASVTQPEVWAAVKSVTAYLDAKT